MRKRRSVRASRTQLIHTKWFIHVRIPSMLATAETADRPPRAAPAQACVLGLLVLAWAAAVGAGIWMLWRYANGPGPSGAAAAAWPGGSSLRPDPARPTLLLFLHPLCPCSRASVEELDVLLARAKIRPAVKALFVRPPGLEPGQERQGLWSSAAKIPGVELAVDADGVEARRFRAETSGHVLLFAPDGSLRF